jgi:hypothetical protein
MLGLLLERGQSYADISGLLGISEDEVRSRARAALTEIGGTDPDRNVGLTDFLLGQADPIGRADAVRHLRADSDDHELAERIIASLRVLAPAAELPKLPGDARTAPHLRPPRRRRPAPDSDAEGARRLGSLSSSQSRLIVGLVAGAIIVAVGIAAAVGAFSGGGSSSATTPPSASTPATTTTTGTGTTTTGTTPGLQTGRPLPLKSVGGTPARGTVAFGNANGKQAFADVRVAHLAQIPQSQVYSVWLMFSAHGGYPLGAITSLSQNGAGHVQLPIPSAVVPVLGKDLRSIDVTVASRTALGKVVRQFVQSIRNKHPKLVLNSPGSPVLRGVIARKSGS